MSFLNKPKKAYPDGPNRSILNSFLTNNKDVNTLILSKLEFKDLRHILVVNKETSVYNSEVLWWNFAQRKRDYNIIAGVKQRSWKSFTLLLVKYICLASGRNNYGMCLAAKEGHRDLVEYFISQGADEWNYAMTKAAEGGHLNLVNFFISKGANNWNRAMVYATQGGNNRDVIDLLISKGADHWNWAMYGASVEGNLDLVNFFIEKGAKDWDWAMEGARRKGHNELENYLKMKKAKNQG